MTACLTKVLEELEEIADESCHCPEDPTINNGKRCRACEASSVLNEISEEMRYGLGRIRKMKGE